MNPLIPQVPDLLENNKLLSSLYCVTDKIHFRAINKTTSSIQSFYGTYNQLHPELTRFNKNGYCIFHTTNATNGLGVKTENITAITALFIDLDDSSADNKATIESLPVKPSIVVETSPNKYHVYWLLNIPDPRIELFKHLQKKLAEKFNSDKSVCDLARVMRVPNFKHMKDKSNPFMSKVIIDNNVKYELDFLIENFGLSITQAPIKTALIKTGKDGVCRDTPFYRHLLKKFINNIPKKNIPTKRLNGNTKLTQVFAPMARDYGLPLEVAQELLWEHLNPICNPPWDEHGKEQFFSFIARGYDLCRNDFGCRTFKPILSNIPLNQLIRSGVKSTTLEPNKPDEITRSSKKGLKQFALNGVSKQMTKQMLDDKFVLKDIAILGQLTVLYAAPNTGKTLVTIKLLIEAVESGVIKGENISYINADDNFNSSVIKLRIFERHSIGMIIPDIVKTDYLGEGNYENATRFKASELLQHIESMIDNNEAKNEIIILDTLKKFTDLMDKKNSTEFSKVLRRFSANGGTVIALAHVNKQSDNNGKKVHAGTSDILDDFDCAFLLENDGETEFIRRVKFSNIKARGNVKREVFFTYTVGDNINYEDLINSVECVDSPNVISANDGNVKLISMAHELIANKVNTKTKLIEQLHSDLKPDFSKTRVTTLLNQNVGKEWEVIDGKKNNTHIYSSILPKAEIPLVL